MALWLDGWRSLPYPNFFARGLFLGLFFVNTAQARVGSKVVLGSICQHFLKSCWAGFAPSGTAPISVVIPSKAGNYATLMLESGRN